MFPAQKRLRPDDGSVEDVHLRLIMQCQLLPLERLAQLDLEFELSDSRSIHILLVIDKISTTTGSAMLHRSSGSAQKILDRFAISRCNGNTYTRCEGNFLPINVARLRQRIRYPLRDCASRFGTLQH